MRTVVKVELTEEQVSKIRKSLEEHNLFETSDALRANNVFNGAKVSAPIPRTSAEFFVEGDDGKIWAGLRCSF